MGSNASPGAPGRSRCPHLGSPCAERTSAASAATPRYNDTVPIGIRAALALVPATLCALAAFFFSFAVTGILWLNLAAGLLPFGLVLWIFIGHTPRRSAIAVASTACLLVLVTAPLWLDRLHARPAADPDDVVRRIARVAIPLDSVDPGSNFADLEPLAGIWRGVRIVALGEATHGTSEFFRMKHRLTKFLVMKMGFLDFAMELEMREANQINDYIQGEGRDNPVARLSWPWRTAEVAAMVDWMRQYNASVPSAGRIHFHGIDYQGDRRDFRMAQNTISLMEVLGAQSRVILWAHNSHVSSGSGWMGSYLKSHLRNEIYLTGFEFHHGRFTSNMNWVRTYEAEPAGNGFYAAALARTGRQILFLDFRTMEEDPVLDAWLQQPRFTHVLQEMHGLLRLNPEWVRTSESWPSLFDGMVYIEQSTPAHLLP